MDRPKLWVKLQQATGSPGLVLSETLELRVESEGGWRYHAKRPDRDMTTADPIARGLVRTKPLVKDLLYSLQIQ